MRFSPESFAFVSESFDRVFTGPFKPGDIVTVNLGGRYDVLYGYGYFHAAASLFSLLNMPGAE